MISINFHPLFSYFFTKTYINYKFYNNEIYNNFQSNTIENICFCIKFDTKYKSIHLKNFKCSKKVLHNIKESYRYIESITQFKTRQTT